MVKRVLAFDLFRGFMIGYVIILHPIIQRVFVQDESQFEAVFGGFPWYAYLIVIPVLMFSIWGSVFILITGAATAYQLTAQLQEPNPDRKKIFKTRWINALLIYGAHWLYVGFFINHITLEHPVTTYSLFTGYFETGTFSNFDGMNLLTSSVLECIAFTGFLVSLIFYLCCTEKGFNLKKVKIILALSALFLFIGCGVFQALVPDPSATPYQMWNEGNYLGHFIYMHLFVVRFPLFPVIGFGLIGALFGIWINEKGGPKKVWLVSLSLLCLGLMVMFLSIQMGFDFMGHFALEIVDFRFHLLNIGLQMTLLSTLWYCFDYRSFRIPKVIVQFFTRYSNTSLTIFLLEAFNSIIIYNFYLWVIDRTEIASSLPLILGYVLGIALEWFVILWLWDKKQFKFSMEWWITQAKARFVDQKNS